MNYKENQTIAEYCGWTQIHPSGRLDGQLIGYRPRPILGEFHEIPNYMESFDLIIPEIQKLGADKIIEFYQMYLKLNNSQPMLFSKPSQLCKVFLEIIK